MKIITAEGKSINNIPSGAKIELSRQEIIGFIRTAAKNDPSLIKEAGLGDFFRGWGGAAGQAAGQAANQIGNAIGNAGRAVGNAISNKWNTLKTNAQARTALSQAGRNLTDLQKAIVPLVQLGLVEANLTPALKDLQNQLFELEKGVKAGTVNPAATPAATTPAAAPAATAPAATAPAAA